MISLDSSEKAALVYFSISAIKCVYFSKLLKLKSLFPVLLKMSPFSFYLTFDTLTSPTLEMSDSTSSVDFMLPIIFVICIFD